MRIPIILQHIGKTLFLYLLINYKRTTNFQLYAFICGISGIINVKKINKTKKPLFLTDYKKKKSYYVKLVYIDIINFVSNLVLFFYFKLLVIYVIIIIHCVYDEPDNILSDN